MKGFEGGSRFTRVKRFALGDWIMKHMKAKAAIDNCRAGRAAKGENHFAPAIKVKHIYLNDKCAFFLHFWAF